MNQLNAKRFLNMSIGAALAVLTAGTVVQVHAAGTAPTWAQVNSAQAPAARAWAASTYDSSRARTVLFGGSNNPSSNLSDTWEWDGTTWTQRTPAVSPPALLAPAMAFDTALGRSVLFGGATGPGSGITSDTWEWDGSTWTKIVTALAPPGRLWHAMAYDSSRDRVVLFGGNGGGVALGDTWEFDGTSWTKRLPATSPSPRYGEALAFDTARNRSVLFGGRGDSGRLGDTWEWDGTTWTQSNVTLAPFPRVWHSMAFDAYTGTTVLFGGDHVEPLRLGPTNDTWEWDGSQWTKDLPSSAPSPRVGQSTVYDSGRGRIVLFGGDNEAFPDVFSNDTWEFGPPPVSDTDLALTSLPGNITVSATSPAGAVVAFTAPIATDEAGDNPAATVSCTPASGSAFAIGTTTVTCTATDADDTPGTVSGTFAVTVNDTDLALGGVPANITTNATSQSGAAVTFVTPMAIDETGDTQPATVACSPASGSTFAIGTTTVTCTATDADDSPSTANGYFTVTVNDTDLALTGMSNNITIDATSPSGALVTYPTATAADEAGDSVPATVSCAPASGSTFAIGTTTVTCTATDADDSPSTANGHFTVTVNDTDLGISGVPSAITVAATAASGAVVTFATPTAVDEAGDNPAAAVSCSPASGSTFATGSTTVTCTASSADDNPPNMSTHFTVTVLVDLRLVASVTPSTGTTGTVITASISLTNDASVSRTVTLVATFSTVSPTGQTVTFTTPAVTVTLAAGKTLNQSFPFKVAKQYPRGTYSFSITASDVTGSVRGGATFKVT